MDSFTLNKIAGAVLGTCLVGMGIGIIADEIYKSPVPKKPGFALPEGKEGGAEGGGSEKSGAPTLPALLAKADPKKGEADAKVCQACHNVEEGAGAKIGPDLYGVVDRPKGSAPGFDYSAGMKKKGGNWTFADLDTFLTKPSAYVQGTKMSYGGESSPEKRADIIVYLRTLSKKPAELPKVAAGEAKGGGGKEAKKEGGGDQLIAMIAASDPKKGESDAQICGACHNFKKGEGAKIGPDLYGVVDRPKGSAEGFDYSAGMKKKGGKWTFADLNTFLTKPSAYVQGTKMGFAGEANEKKRASIIAYLHTLADKPTPLPKGGDKAEDKKADAGGDKAGGDKKAEGGAAVGGDFVKLVAAADGKKGESAAQICGACHNFKKGEGAKIGPDLYGVVDRPKGSAEGFDYSPGMKKKGGKWTYDDLNQFLTKPSAYVQGTKMGFAGEANEKKRALIVAYLRTLADKPAPLPGADGDKPAPEKAAAKPDEKKADAPPAKPATPAPEKKSDSQPQAPSEPPAKSEEKKADAPPPPPTSKPDEKKADAPPPAAKPATPAPEKKSDSQPQAPSEPPKPDDKKADAPPPPPPPAKPDEKKADAPPPPPAAGGQSSDGPAPYSAPSPSDAPAPAADAPEEKKADAPALPPLVSDQAKTQGGGTEPYSAPSPDEAK